MVRERSEICLSYAVAVGLFVSYAEARPSKRVDGGPKGKVKFYQRIRLSNLIRRLLQPPLRGVDPPIALVNVLLHVAHVIVFEAVLALVRRGLVFRLQRLAVHLRTRTQVLLRVGEEVVRAGADQVGPADFRVGEGELRVA